MKTYKGRIDTLPDNGILVFGSNTEGRHGKGIALIAKNDFGAIYGKARGIQGRSFAIVTKDLRVNYQPSRTPLQIREEISQLYKYAARYKDKDFYVPYTKEGSNLNFYEPHELAEMFGSLEIPENIIFEEGFADLIETRWTV